MFSLGRSKASLSAKSSSDGLAQHPLLGSTPSAEAAEASSAAAEQAGSTTLSNLPYKPRQPRHGGGSSTSSIPPPLTLGGSSGTVPTLNVTSASSSASVQQSSVSANANAPSASTPTTATSTAGGASAAGGGVTARLQLQSLKAAGQRMGLRNGSVGMQMLDALFEKGQVSRSGSGGDWGEVLKMVTAGKATLLLPACPQTSSLPMTTQTLRDHVVFPTSSGGTDMLVSLSGLVATVIDGRITIEDCLATDGVVMGMLKEPTTRSTILGNIHAMHPSSSENRPPFPFFTATNTGATLPFPPPPPPPPALATTSRSRSSSNASNTIASVPSIAASRLNPFASLFGGAGQGAAAAASPTKDAFRDTGLSPDRSSRARPPSVHSVDIGSSSAPAESGKDVFDTEPFHIPAWLVDRQLKSAEITKSLAKALRGRVDDELKLFPLPDKLVERTSKFVLRLHPAGSERALGDKDKSESGGGGQAASDAEATSQAVQAFVESVYDEIYAQQMSALLVPESPSTLGSLRRRTSQNSKSRAGGSTDDDDKEKDEGRKKERDKRAAEEQAEKQATLAAESVERVVCCVLYNHLFSPPTTDDARHDEALSSRIAALNLLELSLDHLGIQTRESASEGNTQADIEKRNETVMAGLGRIVEAVGKELELLDRGDCHTAKQKTDHLINAHKLITDGLSKLPPIRLRAEGETDDHLSRINSPLSIDAALDGETADDSGEKVSQGAASVPPPLPPRPRSVKASEASQASSGTPSEGEPPSAPSDIINNLPILELPDAARPSAVEEAMSDSILEQRSGETESRASSAIGALSRVSSGQSAQVPPAFDGGSSGADLLLPLAIYSIVKSNPNRLVSHVLFVQRYRSAICLSGEASYAIVNLTAVIEFLEHVDLAELGLTSTEKVMSVADLSPIGLTLYDGDAIDGDSIASASSRLRGRVNQVGEIAGSAAGSANKVLAGVVDSGWSALRGLIAPNLALPPEAPVVNAETGERPRMPARKGSAFSIHSVTASVANIAAAAASHRERPRAYTLPTVEREMTEVTSRPESLYERDDIDEEDEDEDEAEEPGPGPTGLLSVDKPTRNRAVSSGGKLETERSDRLSISDRFANLSVLGKLGSPGQGDKPLHSPPAETSSISSFLGQLGSSRQRATSTHVAGSHDSTPPLETDSMPIAHLPTMSEDLAPPIERFLTCDAGDLRLSEVGELLRDYRRLARIASNKA